MHRCDVREIAFGKFTGTNVIVVDLPPGLQYNCINIQTSSNFDQAVVNKIVNISNTIIFSARKWRVCFNNFLK